MIRIRLKIIGIILMCITFTNSCGYKDKYIYEYNKNKELEYIKKEDNNRINKLEDSILYLNDCISKCNTYMDSIDESNSNKYLNEDNLIKCYNYDRLYKYYIICKKNPSQWKYYKGWSIRVFESYE